MKKTEATLVCPELKTVADYVKQRERSISDFEHFVEKRKESNISILSFNKEKKRI